MFAQAIFPFLITCSLLATNRAASLDQCADEQLSVHRCNGSDFSCRYGSSQGRCLKDTCRCPEVPNRDPCTCLPQVGDCHIQETSESLGFYSCIVPDNLNPNYDVHILSVYKASDKSYTYIPPTGTSDVSLSVSGAVLKPIVLVLVSYEPIEWRLSVPSGLEIERVILSSAYLKYSRVVDTNDQVKTIEEVSRQDFPLGYGDDNGSGDTVKLLESYIARFGPIASFRGTYRENSWSLTITQTSPTHLPDCGYPPLPINGTASLSSTSSGVEVVYSCFTGLTLKGTQSALCLDSGKWSAPAPSCSNQETSIISTETIAGIVAGTIGSVAILVMIIGSAVIVWRCGRATTPPPKGTYAPNRYYGRGNLGNIRVRCGVPGSVCNSDGCVC